LTKLQNESANFKQQAETNIAGLEANVKNIFF
jgi:hypothetical protein